MPSYKIALGVGGGIAAFKTAMLASRLVQQGHQLSVVATKSSIEFVGPATWAAICSNQPVIDVFDSRYPRGAHIEIAEQCDLMVVAPATARVMASFAHGLADDLIATLYLQLSCPILIAPAMSDVMWNSNPVQRNLETLKSDGVHTIGPNSGWLSCRRIGTGRMAEPDEILSAVESILNG